MVESTGLIRVYHFLVRLAAPVALTACCGWLAACSDEPGVPPPVLIDSRGLDEDLTELIDELLEAVRVTPSSGAMRGRLGMAYDVNQFRAAAIESYAQAAALDPEEFVWPYYRSRLQGEAGMTEEAVSTIDQAIAIRDDYVPAWMWKGTWLLELDRYAEARQAFDRAMELGAGSPAVGGIAQALLRQGRHQEVVDLVEPDLSKLKHPRFQQLLGQAYRGLGRVEDARIALAQSGRGEKLVWRDPLLARRQDYVRGFGPRLAHAQALVRSGQHEKGFREIATLRKLYGTKVIPPELLGTEVWAYIQSESLDQALRVLRDGVAQHPEYVRFHTYFAHVYLMRGENALAEDHLHIVAEREPTNAWAHERLGNLASKAGRHEDALAAYDLALKHGSDNAVQVLHQAGLIEGMNERWPEAVGRFEKAVAIDASYTIGHIYLGRCLAEAGRFEEAEAALAWAERIGTHPKELASARQRIVDLKEGDA